MTDETLKKVTGLNKKEINIAVTDILIQHGPDGHCDGNGILTDFIIELVKGMGIDWCVLNEIEYRDD